MRRTIFEEFDRLFEGFLGPSPETLPEGAKYYGYEAHIGPDGIPHVRTFGNMGELERELPGEIGPPEEEGRREPYADVITDKKSKEAIVTLELPGIEKKDLHITATETEIKISAETKDRKYQKSVPLNSEIDPKKTTARYNNGILEIKAPLRHKEEHRGHSVKVK